MTRSAYGAGEANHQWSIIPSTRPIRSARPDNAYSDHRYSWRKSTDKSFAARLAVAAAWEMADSIFSIERRAFSAAPRYESPRALAVVLNSVVTFFICSATTASTRAVSGMVD